MPLPSKDAMKTIYPAVVLCLTTSFLGACATAPQSPVSLASDALSHGARVGVVMTKMPRVDTAFPGAACLLCMAAASELYVPLQLEKAADGAWNEAPKFPGLTNAYYQVLELGKDAVTSPFLN
jgi:hypothetical protein